MSRSASWNGTVRPNSVHRGAERDHREREERRGSSRATGAIRYTGRSAFVGVIALLEEELDAVGERDSSMPRGPARIGPVRVWMSAITLRSIQMHEQHGDQQRDEHDDHPADQQDPVEPVHQASPPTAAAPARFARFRGVLRRSTASSATVVTTPGQQRVRREPRLVERDEDRALARPVGDADAAARPRRLPCAGARRRRRRGRGAAASSRMDLDERPGPPSAAFSSSARLGQPALVDQQRVGERGSESRRRRAALAAPRPPGSSRRRPRGASSRAHLVVELVERVEPQVAARRQRRAPAKISQSGRRCRPARGPAGRAGCGPPSR